MTNNDDILAELTRYTGVTTTAGTVSSTLIEVIEYLIKGAITFSTLESSTEAFNALGPLKSTLALSSSSSLLGSPFSTTIPYPWAGTEPSSCDGNSLTYTMDKNNHSLVEKNAEKIYDIFDSGHERQSSVSGLVVPSVETAKKLDEILKGNNKERIYETLTALQEVVEDIEKDEDRETVLHL